MHTSRLCIFLELGFEIEQICADGDVRLVGMNNSTEGLVQVCYHNEWGSICSSRFGTREARVICRQIGFPTTGKHYVHNMCVLWNYPI